MKECDILGGQIYSIADPLTHFQGVKTSNPPWSLCPSDEPARCPAETVKLHDSFWISNHSPLSRTLSHYSTNDRTSVAEVQRRTRRSHEVPCSDSLLDSEPIGLLFPLIHWTARSNWNKNTDLFLHHRRSVLMLFKCAKFRVRFPNWGGDAPPPNWFRALNSSSLSYFTARSPSLAPRFLSLHVIKARSKQCVS